MLVDVQTAISYPDPTPITPIGFETFSNPSRPLRLKSRIRNWKHWVTPARAGVSKETSQERRARKNKLQCLFFLNFDRQLQNYVYVHHTIKWIGPHYVANVSLQQCSVSLFAGIKCTG